MNKKKYMNIYIEILFGHKKGEILPFVTTWMDLKDTMLSEIIQTGKDKYRAISLICGI